MDNNFRGWIRTIGNRVEFQTFKSPTDGNDWEAIYTSLTESEKDARIRELESAIIYLNECAANYAQDWSDRTQIIKSELTQANKDRQGEHDLRVKFQGENESLIAQIKEMREALERIEQYEQSPFQSPYSVIQDIKSLAKYSEAK